MIRRLLLLPALLAVTVSATPMANASQPSKLLAQRTVLTQPAAPPPDPAVLVEPPHEADKYPIRADGQPDMLWLDVDVNMTDALNRFYFDPRWRGETWGPFNNYWIIERGCRLMPTWQEYDQFSVLRKFNGVHKFFEKYSGYGP